MFIYQFYYEAPKLQNIWPFIWFPSRFPRPTLSQLLIFRTRRTAFLIYILRLNKLCIKGLSAPSYFVLFSYLISNLFFHSSNLSFFSPLLLHAARLGDFIAFPAEQVNPVLFPRKKAADVIKVQLSVLQVP